MSNKIDKISPLGKRILESLEKQRLTKKFIYENLGISRGTLDNWISGATVPDYNEVQKMLKLLGIGDAQPKPFWDEIRLFEASRVRLNSFEICF